ncbi:MAG: 50S ribosomal protein L10 [Puniceicoccaceae bacterium]|nr:MAG: 50S ribosomal protein L10 [Puniceicoccaceae bacterium]
MRPEKQFLVDEVSRHLQKSDYVFLANYDRITVSEVSDLRDRLAAEQAEFHVVKNSVLRVAAKERSLPDLEDFLAGPTAIVIGGNNPSGVAKIIKSFFAESSKVEVKAGVLEQRVISPDEVKQLADLPTMEVLRAQFLGLLNQPASMLVRVLNAVPTSMVTVLQAKVRQAEEN